jgi:hypothetical protein
MKRPEPPPEVVQYYEWLKHGEPPCCHTCEHYDTTGHCHNFDMRPPDEFTQSIGACDKWQEQIPF